jgi:hypothetical protein
MDTMRYNEMDVSHCQPIAAPHNKPSMSSVLFNVLDNDESSGEQMDDIAELLSSSMMNGIPLLGLDDFVRLSDGVNAKIGQSHA